MKTKIILISLITAKALLSEDLAVIQVNANQDSSSTQISSDQINRTLIENSVTGNGFISSLLEKNPNIQVNDSSKNSSTAGEITPGKISINDAPFYQNNFQIDGVSNDSIIDPNLSRVSDRYDVPGNENEIFIDLDLIESINVYDSNISAEYGNFTGGVIDAKTIRAGAKPSYKISYKHTSDSLTKIHVFDNDSFNKANSDSKQAKFEKHFYSMYASTPINDENGLIISYNRKESIIPGAYLGGFRDKKRLNQSVFAKWSHYFEDDSVLDVTGTYAPYESTHISEYTKDSETKIKGGGASLKANYEKNFDFWNLRSNVALKQSENTKESLNYNKKWAKTNIKDWGSSTSEDSKEGGTGNIEKTSKGISYSLKLESNTIKSKEIEHKLKTGLALSYNEATYNRKADTYYYFDAKRESSLNCLGDSQTCADNDQYLSKRRTYKAENVSADIVSTSAYFENQLKFKNFEFTPGIRFDYNDYLENLDLAHRLNASVKPFNNNKTVIYAGLNRYYGKSFLGYKLREARTPYFDEERNTLVGTNNPSPWDSSADKDSQKYIFSNLDTPYSDEIALGIRQDLGSMRLNLKYINRKAKAKFSKVKGDNQIFTKPDGTKDYYRPTSFANKGYSESDIISLNIGSKEAIEFNKFNLGYTLSTSWRKTTSNSDSYDDILEDSQSDDINKVYYNGQFYDSDKLPKESNPKNINMHLNMAFKTITLFGVPTRINLNNIIRYNLSYNDILIREGDAKKTYQDTLPNGKTKEYEVDIYDKVKFEDALTLDLKASFNFKISKSKSLLVNTEINNVFDKVENVQYQSNNFKLGRQFWFNVAYKF